MTSRLLSFSLGLNLLLLAMSGYVAWNQTGIVRPATKPIPETKRPIENSPDAMQTETAAPIALRWSDLESKDYPIYIANLRKAGCPEPVLRRIIGAELKEFYARKAFELGKDFHRDFWEIAARENVREYFDKTLGPQVKALCQEPDALLKQLVGDALREPNSPPTPDATDNPLTDFLSAEKREELSRLSERYEAQLQILQRAKLSPEEKASQIAQLRSDFESKQAEILSAEELAEFQLRKSPAAKEVQQLYGVDFSENELHNVARAINDYHRQEQAEPDTADSASLDQKLQTVLGPARFADFNRARSSSYRELYEVASEFGQPTEIAAEIFDLRLASEKQGDAIRADKNRSPEEKQALLDALEEQVDQALLTKFGKEAYQSYKTKDGRWINSLGDR